MNTIDEFDFMVLILIVVEDGLVQYWQASKQGGSRVLILIVVEDGLVPGVRTINCNRVLVLILIVVEDGLVLCMSRVIKRIQ